MSDLPVRVRFAPSPTGYLHIGGARTALYNWLLARKHADGKLILRIEDTDRERSTEDAIAQIVDALEWLELGWDEGPVMQSERAERHRECIDKLLENDLAYWDTATAEEVKQHKERTGGSGYRGKPVDEGTAGAAVRLRVPDEGETIVADTIRGDAAFENRLLDDFVVARSDRSTLYNFAVAVDDSDMQITQVVRGDDHLSNTPRQILVMRALGVEPPSYAHLPLLNGVDGKPLSKRHGAASVQELREKGYLPAAVRNYLALLGWGYDAETTFFTTEELVDKFSLERVSRSPAVFDEEKLSWMNGQYLRDLPDAELAGEVAGYLRRTGLPGADDPRLERAAAAAKEKLSSLAEFQKLVGFAFAPVSYDDKAWRKVMGKEGAARALEAARQALADVEPFELDAIEQALRSVVDRLGVKPGTVFQPVRVAITGSNVSAGIFESLELLGKEQAIKRMDAALERLNSS
jgi:glutamyl-tRNA synthetase